jgi:hypothetical protein
MIARDRRRFAGAAAREEKSMINFSGRSFAFVSAAGVALFATAACAQTAKPKQPSKASAITIVTVTNSRSVALTELDATRTDGFVPKIILRNLAPGKKAPASIATDQDCVFDLHGAYVDGSKTESTGVNLCKDKTVNLVD